MKLRSYARPRRVVALVPVLLLAVAAAAGCGGDANDGKASGVDDDLLDWARAASLTAAANCDDAVERLQDNAIVQMDLNLDANRRCYVDPQSCFFRGGIGTDDMAVGAPEAGRDEDGSDAPDDFSETNVQVEGVDEADRVKTDGTHIYTLSDRSFVVMKSWPPADLDELARISLRSAPQSFFLERNRAIVLGYGNLDEVVETPSGATEDEIWEGEFRGRSVATVTVIDLADKANPRIVREYFFEGSTIDSRRIDSKVYLAQNHHIWFDDLEYWPDLGSDPAPSREEIDAAFDALRERNVAKIRARGLDDWLPRVWESAEGGAVDPGSGRAVSACTDVHVPSVFSGQSLLSLITIDLDSAAVVGSTIQGEWGNVYASRDALYIGSTNWEFFWWWRSSDEAPPILTHIHKFAFDSGGVARYAASGEVVGYALNQFAFDEHEGHLRVATTDGLGWWNDNESESRVTVLAQRARRLEQVGLVTGLGPDERIFGVRFLGDLAYVVTFRQVDPLYVVDLSDPARPRVAGELKIPGFSSYIHPLADGFLLTAGRDGDDDGNIGGVKIEIFDVTDPARPFSVATSVVGDGWNTWSDVLWDHKAFVFFRARNLLAIPVSGWEETFAPNGWWGEFKSELALFRVTPATIEPLPSVSHMGFFEEFGGHGSCRFYSGYWQAGIVRGLFADDYVYSLSHLGIQVHDSRAIEAGPVAAVTLVDPNAFGGIDWEGCRGTIEPGARGDDGDDPDAVE